MNSPRLRITDPPLGTGRFKLRFDREGAEWLAEQAADLFSRTRDYGWKEIADDLDGQLGRGDDE